MTDPQCPTCRCRKICKPEEWPELREPCALYITGDPVPTRQEQLDEMMKWVFA